MTQLSRSFSIALAAAAVLAAGRAPADIFLLENGGEVSGQWVNRDDQAATTYQLRADSVTIELPARQVRESVRQSGAELEYLRRAPAMADTAEAQWQMAEWCRQNGLRAQRFTHAERVVQLDPNHQQARQALGQQFIGGRWTAVADVRRQEGYELYRGKWRTPQEIEILESRAQNEQAEKEWLGKLKKWRRELDDPDKHKLAYESLAAIRDPVAVAPLAQYFAGERLRKVKALYADALARINTAAAVKVLVDRALSDPDEEVFYYCIGKLVEMRPPHVSDLFIEGLKDKNNFKVNRGAIALARLYDKSAVSALIEALVTTHAQVVRQGRGSEATTSVFGSDGTFMKKGDPTDVAVYHVHNQPVLDALSKLTGVDFGFDQKAWRYWYSQDKIAREASQPVLDARRQ